MVLGFLAMTETDQTKEDEVLKRLLRTPHKPHTKKGDANAKAKDRGRNRESPEADDMD